jgi:hypothetical protein
MACAAMALSGVVHLAITTEHSTHAPAHGLFFAALGVFQIGWAAAYWILPRRWLRWAGVVLSGGMIVLWAVTRSFPAPFHGVIEEVDLAGVVSNVLEAIAFVSLLMQEAGEQGILARRVGLILAGPVLAVLSGLAIYATAFALEPIAPPILAASDKPSVGEQASIGHAHVGTRRIQLDDIRAGPYLVRAVTAFGSDPSQDLALEVRVTDGNSRKTLTDAAVRVFAENPESGDFVEAAVLQGEATIPRDYGAQLDLPEAGAWHMVILIEGALGEAQTGFDLLVPSGGGFGIWLGAYLPFGGLLLLIVAYLLLTRARPSEG